MNKCIDIKQHSEAKDDVGRNEKRVETEKPQNFLFPFSFSHFTFCRPAMTLAEVLITLGIIGVVAALTIPNLIESYQKQQFIGRLKEAYSLVNQTLTRAAADSGGNFSNLFQYDSDSVTVQSRKDITTNFVATNITPYVKVSNDCAFDRTGSCARTEKYLNGNINYTSTWQYLLYLNNGMALEFVPNNTGTRWIDMIIIIDINGNKPPNIYGKDIFEMLFTTTSAKPNFYMWNASRATVLNDCKVGGGGTYCGALIMKDNWTVSDQYPWN